MREFFVAQEGFILGAYRTVGESLGMLSAAEAKYPEMSGQITSERPKAEKPKQAPVKEKAKASEED